MKSLRIIYMGTPEFAVPGLELLVQQGYQVVAVVTAPDKPQGRGLQLAPSAVKKAAVTLGIPVLQPEKLKDPEFLEALKAFDADVQVVVAFRMLPELVWNMPPLGTFNLHASLLPQYRGAAPINWAIINGEVETGVTTFFLKHEIDTGDLILQEREPIYLDDTLGTLYERLKVRGAGLIAETVRQIASGNVSATPQQALAQLKVAPKLQKDTGRLLFTKTAESLHNLVRGLNPTPSAYMYINTLYTKVHRTEVLPNDLAAPFETDRKSYLHLKTAYGTISILELQPEGKKRMSIREYLAGNPVNEVS